MSLGFVSIKQYAHNSIIATITTVVLDLFLSPSRSSSCNFYYSHTLPLRFYKSIILKISSAANDPPKEQPSRVEDQSSTDETEMSDTEDEEEEQEEKQHDFDNKSDKFDHDNKEKPKIKKVKRNEDEFGLYDTHLQLLYGCKSAL
jgi:hypothetical protein